jgi:hypothetical protein
MDITQVVVKLIKDAVTSVVGSKVHPMVIPQNNLLPAITYQLIGENLQRCMNGSSTLRVAKFQVNSYSKNVSQINQMYELLLAGCQEYKGTVIISTESVDVQVVTINRLSDTYDSDVQGYACQCEMEVTYHGTPY